MPKLSSSFPTSLHHKPTHRLNFRIEKLIQRNNAQKDASRSYAFHYFETQNFLPQGRFCESWDPYAIEGRFPCPDGAHKYRWSLSPAGLQEWRRRRVLQTIF